MRVFLTLFVLLVAVVLFSISDEKLNRKSKITIALIATFIAILAYFYESSQTQIQSKNLDLLTKFNQGQVLICGDLNVSNKKFHYEFGTSSFVAKREFNELGGIKIQIDKCKK